MSIRVWEAAARNHRGMQRAQNLDNFYLNGKWMSADAMEHGGRALAESAAPFQLYAVCDGLGGGVAGGLASLTAVMALQDWQTEWPEGVTIPELTHALRVLTDRVHALGAGGSEPAGTTLVACLWQQDRLTVLHAGDSRAYRLRAGKLTQLTTDHSEVQRLVGLGLLTPYQARLSPRRHLIHQYIGLPSWEEAFHPTVAKPLEVLPGDRFLLCSDGLHDMVIGELSEKLDAQGIHYEMDGRPKHLYSIYKKMTQQGKTFDQIYDLIAVRIIVDTVQDCYTVLGIVHTLWNQIPGRFKDYISVPKSNMATPPPHSVAQHPWPRQANRGFFVKFSVRLDNAIPSALCYHYHKHGVCAPPFSGPHPGRQYRWRRTPCRRARCYWP